MYPPGHVGVALVLYAPLGLLLLLRGRPRLAVAGAGAISVATLLPDVDQWLPWFVHRGLTHSVWFALAAGLSLGAVAAIAASYRHRKGTAILAVGAFGFVVGALAVVAHILADVITPMGVRPFYPVYHAHYTLDLVYASDPTANSRLLALGCLVTVAQMLVGVGLGPTTPRRPTLHGGLRAAVRLVRLDGRRAGAAASGHTEPPNRRVPRHHRIRETDD